MEMKIDLSVLQKQKLFIATPMYGGQCTGMYTRSIADLSAMCTRYGIEMRSYFLFNESLITRARNYCVDEFLRSGYDHLMFIDSDIGFNPNDVFALMALQAMNPDKYHIISGPYPKKCITWEKIKMAVDKGFADNNPNDLEAFVGDFVFNPVGHGSIPLNEPAEVMETGTGFMMIARDTFLEYDKHYPQYKYLPDHVRTENFDGTREIMAYFDCIIDPVSKRYLSEDYMFCQNVRKVGMKVWLCPWMHLQHSGFYTFAGSLPALAAVGASATADINELAKTKKK